MLLKLITLAVAALTLWAALRKVAGGAGPGGARPPAAPRTHKAQDLTRCPSCGAWSAPGETCPCANPPIP
jgi:hypothetical protein